MAVSHLIYSTAGNGRRKLVRLLALALVPIAHFRRCYGCAVTHHRTCRRGSRLRWTARAASLPAAEPSTAPQHRSRRAKRNSSERMNEIVAEARHGTLHGTLHSTARQHSTAQHSTARGNRQQSCDGLATAKQQDARQHPREGGRRGFQRRPRPKLQTRMDAARALHGAIGNLDYAVQPLARSQQLGAGRSSTARRTESACTEARACFFRVW
jgi:hypothetical protein